MVEIVFQQLFRQHRSVKHPVDGHAPGEHARCAVTRRLSHKLAVEALSGLPRADKRKTPAGEEDRRAFLKSNTDTREE
jgi:hypothetical protein